MVKKSSPRSQSLVGSIFIVLSMLAALFAGDQFIKGMRMRSEWNKVEAVVTRLETSRSGRRNTVVYTPWFSFHDPISHRAYSVKGRIGSSSPLYKTRQKVELLYPAEHPENAIVNTFFEVYLLALVLTFVFVLFGFIGLVACRAGKDSPSQGEVTAS